MSQSISPWISPLSAIQYAIPQEKLKPKKLIFDEEPCLQDSVADNYGKRFAKPGPGQAHDVQFFSIYHLLFEIEKWIETNTKDKNLIDLIRVEVKKNLKIPYYKKKVSELSLILFYLDKNQNLPPVQSYLTHRGQEMLCEIEKYLDLRNTHCQNDNVTSGKTHYILRAFAHMVFTSTQFFNKSALLVIEELLTEPTYALCQHLQPEHREHILSICTNIGSNSAFCMLFKKKITPHNSIIDLLRFDLKLQPQEEVNSVLTLRACMLCFFTDIRQINGSNCYAIATLVYAQENATYIAFKQLIHWIEKGSFSVGDSTSIPVSPPITNCLSDQAEPTKLEPKTISSLAPLKHLSATLNIPLKNNAALPLPVEEFLLSMAKTSQEADYIDSLYKTYKKNALVHLQLSILEFININQIDPLELDQYAYRHFKTLFLDQCMRSLIKQITFPKEEDKAFWLKIHQTLSEKIWIINQRKNNIKLSAETIQIDSAPPIAFQGNPRALKEVLKNACFVFLLQDNEFKPVYKLTELQFHIEKIIKNIHSNSQEKKQQLLNNLKSLNFKKELSIFCASKITPSSFGSIQEPHLQQSDLLLFSERGGFPTKLLKTAFNIKSHKNSIPNYSKPIHFIDHLSKKNNRLNFLRLKSFPKTLLSSRDHVWTLSPLFWNQFTQHQNSAALIQMGQNALSSLIPKQTVYTILQKALTKNDYFKATAFFSRFPKLTYRGFRYQLLANATPRQTSLLSQILDEEFSKICLRKQDLTRILKKLNLHVDNVFHQIYAALPNTPSFPFTLSNKLQKLFIEHGISVQDPHTIERAICEVMQLPNSIYVGDLNWVNSDCEDPHHVSLTIRFNWANSTLSYYERYRSQDHLVNQEQYKQFTFIYPKSP
ncbi:MAG: hypothetical protein S4CHLAM123_08440 [Chlamydiales bacterium]|nr:hypothetical protein [Chlamydiales bacterium]